MLHVYLSTNGNMEYKQRAYKRHCISIENYMLQMLASNVEIKKTVQMVEKLRLLQISIEQTKKCFFLKILLFFGNIRNSKKLYRVKLQTHNNTNNNEIKKFSMVMVYQAKTIVVNTNNRTNFNALFWTKLPR